jgi:phosphatidylglycerophosphate synthase
MFKRELIAELKAAGYRPRAWAVYVRRHFDAALGLIAERPGPVRSVVAHGIALFVLFFFAALALGLTHGLDLGRRFFLAGALWVGLLCGWVLAHLGLLTDLAGRPLFQLGWPNALSLLRGATVPALLVLAGAGEHLLAVIVLAIGAATDVLDGYIARRYGPLSRLGVIMDAIIDITWYTAAFLAFTRAGLLPRWILALVMTRYGLLLTGAAVLYLRHTRLTIRPTRFGKATGALISIGLFLLLVNRILFDGTMIPGPAHAVAEGLLESALGILAGATVLHVLLLGALALRAGESDRRRAAAGRAQGSGR